MPALSTANCQPSTARRFALALGVAAAVILSAPFAQQAFTAASAAWPRQFRALGISATAGPAAVALVAALVRIREFRALRYMALALGFTIGAGYILINGLGFGESFHFVEYGLLALLFYRAWRPRGPEGEADASLVLLPLLSGAVAGVLDEWFQWFLPFRVGEARDVGLNTVALGCGLLVAIAVGPPTRVTLALRPRSLRRVGGLAGAVVVAFALFFQSVHLGYDIADGEIGVFRSRYSAAGLDAAARARAETWRDRPPVVVRRVSREDQYLSEGIWHVQRRNDAWAAGDAFGAWRENLILEEYYAPVLDAPSYSSTSGHRWPPEQRADAAARAAADHRAYVSTAYPTPSYAWPRTIYWGAHAMLLAAIAALCWRYGS